MEMRANKICDKYVWGTDVKEPSEDQRIWRYITLPSLLYLLAERRLHFSHIWELDDLAEGRISQAQVNDLGLDLEDQGRIELLPTLIQMYTNFTMGCAISCWHANETESVAMWQLYTTGDDGVAISTTVGKLMNCLTPKGIGDSHFNVGFVKYINHNANIVTETPPERQTALQSLFHKSREYVHEQEVRIVVVMPQNKPYPRSELDFPLTNLSFIEQIIVSPRFPTWALPALQSVISTFGVTLNMGTSVLRESLRPR
jgi:hypothetical protein